jgi:hypothetical protein
MAMRAESAPLVAALGATPVALNTAMPIEGFQATIRGCLVTVVVNGRHPRHGVDLIGTDAATISFSVRERRGVVVRVVHESARSLLRTNDSCITTEGSRFQDLKNLEWGRSHLPI